MCGRGTEMGQGPQVWVIWMLLIESFIHPDTRRLCYSFLGPHSRIPGMFRTQSTTSLIPPRTRSGSIRFLSTFHILCVCVCKRMGPLPQQGTPGPGAGEKPRPPSSRGGGRDGGRQQQTPQSLLNSDAGRRRKRATSQNTGEHQDELLNSSGPGACKDQRRPR